MNERLYCRVLIYTMAGCLPCLLLIPQVRTGKAAMPFAIALLIGISVNLLYLHLRKHQRLDFLVSVRPVRRLFRFLLCSPLFFVFGFVILDACERRSPLFNYAIHAMQDSAVAKKDLGVPLEVGWPIEVNTDEAGGSGRSILRIPVSGSHGKGTLRVIGIKVDGAWRVNELTLILQNGNVRESLQPGGQQEAN